MTQQQQIPGISEQDIARVRQPLEKAHTLPAAAYLREEVYQLELQHIMRKSWIPIARVEQLPTPGSYLTLDLFGQPVMAVHGADGCIRVMSNVCLHRAAPIAQGCGRRRLFTCPYHAWSYDTCGQLMSAPLMEGAAGFVARERQLPQVRSEVWQGFVMANLDPEADAFAPQVQPFADYFQNFRLSEMLIVNTLEFDSAWNWKVLVENFMEAYHHIATHSRSLEAAYHARDSKVPDNHGPWSILHMPGVAASQPPLIEGLDEAQAKDLYAAVVYPHFLLGIHGGGVAWYQVFPQAADQLMIKIHILLPESAQQLAEFEQIVQAQSEMVSLIHHEDIAANDLVWQGLKAPLTKQGRLSPLEKAIWQLNQWWLQAMPGTVSP